MTDEDRKAGMIVAVRECPRCLRLLAPASADDCPDHTLPCCGGRGAEHASGCASDPMYQAGVRRGLADEEEFLRRVFG